MRSGAAKSNPPASAMPRLSPSASDPPLTVASTMKIGMATKTRKNDVTRLSSRSG